MRLFVVCLLLSSQVPSFAGATASPVQTIELQCFSPVSLRDFERWLDLGDPAQSVPWSYLDRAALVDDSRLSFIKSLEPDQPAAQLILKADDLEYVIRLAPLTEGHERLATMSRSRGSMPKSKFHRLLEGLNAKYQVFILRKGITELALDQRFSGLLDNGALTFAWEESAIILSPKFESFSLCLKSFEYLIDRRAVTRALFDFLNDREIIQFLKCNQALRTRT